MIVVGLTGGVGTGKSTVAKMFAELGAVVLDADAIARELVEPKRLAWRSIVKTFGSDILNEDQTINRQQLGELVFGDEERRTRLEAIVHPQVIRRIKQQLHRLRRNRKVDVVVLDVPLLVEAGAKDLVDELVVVTAPLAVQRERLRRKWGWSTESIDQRINAQWDLSTKAALADVVIDNADGIDHTRRQVKQLWRRLGQARRRGSISPR